MLFNIKALSKAEVNKRLKFKCVHRHNGIDHHRCFDQENGLIEKIAFLDIEATDLTASWGYVICYVIGDEEGKNYIKRTVDIKDLNKRLRDKNLISQFIEDIKPFNRIVVHWGSDRKFDIPMLRTRAEIYKLPFPPFKSSYVTDTWNICKAKLCLKRNSLAEACRVFGIQAKEHPIVTDYWQDLQSGNPKYMQDAIDYILVHCVEDVVSLRSLFYRICKYSKLANTSI